MLRIHFLNVGHGDCTIIEHPSGRLTMVDINNGDELDETSHREVLAALSGRRAGGLRGQNTLATLLSGTQTTSPSLGGLLGLGDLARTNPRQGLGATLLTSGLDNPPRLGLGALALLGRSKKDELTEAGYSIELTNPVEYFVKRFPGRSIFRYIQTHPDLDHMRGLVALREHGIRIDNFWDTEHDKIVPKFKNASDRQEWAEYQRLRGSSSSPKTLRHYQSARGSYWNEDSSGGSDHDSIEILSPTPDIARSANEQDKSNNLSYVLHISYAGRTIILGGDAEADVWEQLYQTYGHNLKCDVLKAGHHGRDSGYHANAVKAMNPTYTVVSVGKKPDTDASNKYRQYCNNVRSTRWYGDLTLEINPRGEMRWTAKYA